MFHDGATAADQHLLHSIESFHHSTGLGRYHVLRSRRVPATAMTAPLSRRLTPGHKPSRSTLTRASKTSKNGLRTAKEETGLSRHRLFFPLYVGAVSVI